MSKKPTPTPTPQTQVCVNLTDGEWDYIILGLKDLAEQESKLGYEHITHRRYTDAQIALDIATVNLNLARKIAEQNGWDL